MKKFISLVLVAVMVFSIFAINVSAAPLTYTVTESASVSAKGTLSKELFSIDVIVDDDPYNYKMITSNGCKCILFDDREKYNLRDDYATNWLEVEDFIDKMRG